MNWQEYNERDPAVMLGKPVFKGTRIAGCKKEKVKT